MAKFDSPLGSRNITNTQVKEFSVPDESGFMPPQHHIHPQKNSTDNPIQFDQQALQEFNMSLQNQQPMPQMREMNDVERQILEAKKAKREGKERLSEGARRRVEMLIGMTRLNRELDIGGQTYKLQSLKGTEFREAMVMAAEFDGTVHLPFETRKQLLARSLIVVAGLDIVQFLNSNNMQDRVDFIEELPHDLLLVLYNEYLSLAREFEQKFTPKNTAEVKRVMDDLKK